jgi:hypothetical protein
MRLKQNVTKEGYKKPGRNSRNHGMTNTIALGACLGIGVAEDEVMFNKYSTHHQMSFAMTVKFIGNVNRSASSFGHSNLALLLWLKVADDVVELWVFEQLIGCHRSHDERRSIVLVCLPPRLRLAG